MGTKNRNRQEKLIRPRDTFHILLFIGICLYLATCGISRQDNPNTNTVSEKKSTYKLRKDIVAFAQKQIGKKYRYAGRGPKKFDCSGLTHFVMKNFEIDLTPISRSQESEGKVIAVSKVRPGDLVFFRRSKKGSVYHVGLVIENGSDGVVMVHSSSSRGVVVDNIAHNSYWKTKIITARDVISK